MNNNKILQECKRSVVEIGCVICLTATACLLAADQSVSHDLIAFTAIILAMNILARIVKFFLNLRLSCFPHFTSKSFKKEVLLAGSEICKTIILFNFALLYAATGTGS